ncbi:MAG: acetate kinase [Bacteroidota bacterium]
MKVLVINSGSSSIKYQLIAMPLEEIVAEGLVERVGSKNAVFRCNALHIDMDETLELIDHKMGLQKIADTLLNPVHGIVRDAREIEVVAHRVVHGGTTFSKTTLINRTVKNEIKALFALAPLHNPHNLEGIVLSEEIFPDARQVAVFDTAFHRTLPMKAKRYALPHMFYDRHGIQVYGFHGTSHKYVSEKARDHLQNKMSKIITVHLGNGCSVTAVSAGKSIDHSLGFTPSNGLIMGSRSGDIDHSIIFYLVETLGYKLEDVNNLLIKESGMMGLTGFNDLRDIQAEAEKGNTDCMLALEMNSYRIKKYIGAYTAAMNGLDAIVFTAGIGENSALIRKMVCSEMDYLGIDLDDVQNQKKSVILREIHTASSKVKILIIPTNEELEIAKQAFHLVHDN